MRTPKHQCFLLTIEYKTEPNIKPVKNTIGAVTRKSLQFSSIRSILSLAIVIELFLERQRAIASKKNLPLLKALINGRRNGSGFRSFHRIAGIKRDNFSRHGFVCCAIGLLVLACGFADELSDCTYGLHIGCWFHFLLSIGKNLSYVNQDSIVGSTRSDRAS